jgi:excisionase family DNA binding protein
MGKARRGPGSRFTTGELARLISASRNTVVRYIMDGRLRARRTAGGWYVVDFREALDFLWDLSFSKDTPLRIWRAASLAYDDLSKIAQEPVPEPVVRRRRKKT